MDRCRNGTGINQLAIGWHEHAVNASGIIVLERSNWEDTFRVPVVATVDHKVEVDNYTEVNFTIKMVVDGSIDNTTKILVRRIFNGTTASDGRSEDSIGRLVLIQNTDYMVSILFKTLNTL